MKERTGYIPLDRSLGFSTYRCGYKPHDNVVAAFYGLEKPWGQAPTYVKMV